MILFVTQRSKAADAKWFALPSILPVTPQFRLDAIVLNILIPKDKPADAPAKKD
jgi:xanthine/uracil permease